MDGELMVTQEEKKSFYLYRVKKNIQEEIFLDALS
jgi:hypothetical protein